MTTELEIFKQALSDVDSYIQKNPARLWYLENNIEEIQVPPVLADRVGGARPVGEVAEGSYTPARYPKRYFTRQELLYSDKKFNPHTAPQQLFQFRSLIAAIITRTSYYLGLPSTTINRALHTFHHFYLFKASAEEFAPKEIAFACVFIASKEEDTRKKLNEVIEAGEVTLTAHFPSLTQARRSKTTQETIRQRCLELESHLLAIQCYQFSFVHPSHLLVFISRAIKCPKEISQFAFHITNDCFLFQFCLQFTPQVIACGSLFLASRIRAPGSPLADHPDWYTRFTCRPADIKEFVTDVIENCLLTKQLLNDIHKSDSTSHHHYQGVMATCLQDDVPSDLLKEIQSSAFKSPLYEPSPALKPRLSDDELEKLFNLPSNQHPNGTRFIL